MKTVNQVLMTNDYKMFKTLEGNRNVNKLHVFRLKESFQKKYLLSPILVNDKNEIIDGQHRFMAAIELELPIYYIQVNGYGLKEVQMLNTNMKNWSKQDYLNAFCDLKYVEYLKFRNFMRQFPAFGIASCEILLTDRLGRPAISNYSFTENKSHSYSNRYFEEGELKIQNYERSTENAEKIMMIKPYYSGFDRAIFVRSMIGIFKIEYYNHTQLLERLNANPTALQHCANVTQYKLMIEDIYNFRSRDKVTLRF